MDHQTTPFISLLFSFACFLSLTTIASSSTISAIYLFGDSTADTGNNNDLPTTSRSNFPPYGQDFPNRIPTGRFSNGKLSLDLSASLLGIKDLIPPYLDRTLANDTELLTGVCFASAGSGLDPLTAKLAKVLSLPEQILLFEKALLRIKILVGVEKAKSIVESALIVIYSGANDFINYYNKGVRSFEYSNISDYQDFVLRNLKDDIQRLYNLGGRKILVKSLEPIGCLPIQITRAGRILNNRTCIEKQNNDSFVFNQKLQPLLSELEQQLRNVTLIYFDVFTPFLDVINNPAKYGFEVASRGCCGMGLFEFGLTCKEPIKTCPDPSKYLFWDAVHPTEAVYKIEAGLFETVVASS